MRKIVCIFVSMVLVVGKFFSVTLDTELLASAKKVSYIEDTSPVSKAEYNTREEIKNIGRLLAGTILRQEKNGSASPLYAYGEPAKKYRVSRVYESELLPGSDVLYLAPNAKVTTAKALFLIVSGYIEKAFSLSEESADLLAKKICYWNTNHYDERNYFEGRFSANVMKAFAGETAVIGLADSYKNWAGHARIVIPFQLSNKTANASANENAKANANTETNANKMADSEKKVSVTKTNNATKSVRTKSGMPLSYKILFVALCLAVLLLVILLIKVIRDLIK